MENAQGGGACSPQGAAADGKDEERRSNAGRRLSKSEFQQAKRSLKTQLLECVAGEVVSLKIGAAWLALYTSGGETGLKPHVLLPRMRQLESLHVEGPLHRAILQELPALRHLTSLKLGLACSMADLREVCRTLALLRLELAGIDGLRASDSQWVLAVLASGKTAGLQELVLPFPASEMQHLSGLSALSTLTALSVHAGCSLGDLSGLPSITGLKSLRLEARHFHNFIQRADLSLAPLAALTELTLLDLDVGHVSPMAYANPPRDVSVLSTLTALRVLRCSCFAEAEVAAGDPLPVELRFLRTAPALEVLDLGFGGSFWSLPDASIHAVREAVRGLLSVKQITVHIVGKDLEGYYLPLSAFAAAPSTETLSFTADEANLEGPEDSPDQARDCFRALTKLRSLSLASGTAYGPVHHWAELLAGLPSTDLTSLCVKASTPDVSLMQEIARFRDLQSLSLAFEGWDWLPSLAFEECDLKCLTHLEVDATSTNFYRDTKAFRRVKRRLYEVSSASMLETSIREYGQLVGFPVRVTVRHV